MTRLRLSRYVKEMGTASFPAGHPDEIGLLPAPRVLLAALYALILLPVLGTLLLLPLERLVRSRMLQRGLHLSALEVQSHARGALILGLVWSLAFCVRGVLLEALLAVA